MKTLVWNCYGLGNPLTVKALQDWCWRDRPNIVFVMETKMDAGRLELVHNRCGFENGFCLSSNGRSEGLGFWWRDIKVNICSYSLHHIEVEVCDSENVPKWKAVGIYGWPEAANKHYTWELMRAIKARSSLPTVMFGDFNEIMGMHEKEGGAVRGERQLDAFREAIEACDCRDLGYKGNIFTWKRGTSMETMVRERLDRYIADTQWCSMFPYSEVIHFPICHSNHAAILLKFGDKEEKKKNGKLFRFEAMWLSRNECGAVQKRIKMAERKLKETQGRALDAQQLLQCNEIVDELDDLRRLEESYWHARARANELRDVNKRGDGCDYCRVLWWLFASGSPDRFDEALVGVEMVVTNDMWEMLEEEPTGEEIREALFQMHPNKAPGPDGMHALFFQKFWGVIGGDVIRFVKGWWRGEVDLKEVNRTCIVLIPKVNDPKRMTEFRPISLCNVLYKIISKTLANKLKTMLGTIISENQSAFVPKRLTTDNALVAFEIFHSMKRRGEGKDGTIALKLDMSKAYDRVEWVFLERVMLKMGFQQSWIGRIMQCLNSVSFSFKYNGSISGALIPTRGLRQGDPISPYLFLICADAFSMLLKKAVTDNAIHEARVCRGAPRVSHLFFADDSILFAKANLHECSKVADIISTYERESGQKVNLSKTEVAFSKCVEEGRRQEIVSTLGVRVVDKHEKYLGLPTIIGRSKKAVFACLKGENLEKATRVKGETVVSPGKGGSYKGSSTGYPKIYDERIQDTRRADRRDTLGSGSFLVGIKRVGAEDSLAQGVLKEKYYKHSDFLDAFRGYDPSYTWRSIWGAKALLLDGMKWRVGNGSSIRVWDDSWLPSEGNTYVPTPGIDSNPDMQVYELINFDEGGWDVAKVEATFNGDDCRAMLDIPISNFWPQDRRYWWSASDGVYTVRTGYWLGRLGQTRAWEMYYGERERELWRVVWQLGEPPKLCHFIWRACKGSLGVMDVLCKRHIRDNSQCPVCGAMEETLMHAVFECKYASTIWSHSEFFGLLAEAPCESFEERFVWLAGKMERDQLRVVASLAWAAWFCRNKGVFDAANTVDPVSIAAGFVKLNKDYGSYMGKVGMVTQQTHFPSASTWIKPPEFCVKVNVDAHTMEGIGVRFGVVIRDENGKILLAAVKSVGARWKPALAEAGAARYGLELARRMGYKTVILECDALNVVRAIQEKQDGAKKPSKEGR
ncbi:uncharacterized protein [Spinacia oleracea]|uniref:Reverse transcriptase domain-containing protein n=1 Tax=Spinacia oleracea TaxID=3562 RepID=A0ABM3QZI9_SPIOL|nr:uncharacterized protein LOC130463586 [Spinacia oleracea]